MVVPRLSSLALGVALVLAARAARAQPELAQIHDDNELTDAIAAIAQDPIAQALIREGVRQQQAQAYDQALANFLAAYDKVPSPKLLLHIASTLREMGRLADAANTYQRYLADPASDRERAGEVKDSLARLDQQLAVLVVHGGDVSVDGGPFVAVGGELVTRVRPGLHLVRVRTGGTTAELTVNAFEGETKDVPAAAPAAASGGRVYGWLVTGTQYGAASAIGRERSVRAGYAGPEVAPIMPRLETSDAGLALHRGRESHISSGVLALARIDGEGRGFAGGLGITYSPHDRVEVELAGLRSQFWGAYVGARYRFWTRKWRPYVAAGVPSFFFTDDAMRTKVALGARVAGGIELVVNAHLSIAGDLGYEHFFDVGGELVGSDHLDADYFIPTLGLIGRM
jgi:hypothetical protein